MIFHLRGVATCIVPIPVEFDDGGRTAEIALASNRTHRASIRMSMDDEAAFWGRARKDLTSTTVHSEPHKEWALQHTRSPFLPRT